MDNAPYIKTALELLTMYRDTLDKNIIAKLSTGNVPTENDWKNTSELWSKFSDWYDKERDKLAANPFASVSHIPKTDSDIDVGDIFYSTWGATMTMVTYWKVVKRTAQFVTLRELDTYEESDGGFLSGYSKPLDKFKNYSNVYSSSRFEDTDGKVYSQCRVKLTNGSTKLKIKSYMYAYPWNGKPKYYNHCD